jgi:hypothetical protein
MKKYLYAIMAFVFIIGLIFLIFLVGCTTTTVTSQIQPTQQPKLEAITKLASNSSCASYSWKNRGIPPKGYIKGMALTFAKAICQPERSDVKLVSSARKLPESVWDLKDALSWYNSNFNKYLMSNDKTGASTLRNTYVLLIGLGMRESSGKYCSGRDMSASFNTAESAEAGLFQASWGASRASIELSKLFTKYTSSEKGCLLETFKEGAKCTTNDTINWGSGNGMIYQQLAKKCPSFAAEYSAVVLRTLGGTKGEFGPIRRKEVELIPECDSMLIQIQQVIKEQPELCKDL